LPENKKDEQETNHTMPYDKYLIELKHLDASGTVVKNQLTMNGPHDGNFTDLARNVDVKLERIPDVATMPGTMQLRLTFKDKA
jgi:hypothetical protein